MYHSIHTDFILSPIMDILKESINACIGIGCGIETQPLCEYIMQSTFLKLTGASEQKLKCICWELASNDYEYRYNYLRKPYGECSSREEKNTIYKTIIAEIQKYNETFAVRTLVCDKVKWLKNIKNNLIDEFENSSWVQWMPREYAFYKDNAGQLVKGQIWQDNLFEQKVDINRKTLSRDYEYVVYRHRNRCAHNLISYQENLPQLGTLLLPFHCYENYFYRYNILVVLDEIFMLLFRTYLKEYRP